MVFLIVVVTTALGLLPTASSDAATRTTWSGTPTPGPRFHGMTFNFARTVAVDYWAKRDINVPCQSQARVYTYADLEDEMARDKARGTAPYVSAMWSDVATCTVEITPWTDALRSDHDLSWVYCADVAHEIGHLAGLEHEYGGIMNHDLGVVPWGCDHPRKFLRRLRFESRMRR